MKKQVMMKKSQKESWKFFFKCLERFFNAINIVRQEQKSFFVFSFLNKNLKKGQFLEIKSH